MSDIGKCENFTEWLVWETLVRNNISDDTSLTNLRTPSHSTGAIPALFTPVLAEDQSLAAESLTKLQNAIQSQADAIRSLIRLLPNREDLLEQLNMSSPFEIPPEPSIAGILRLLSNATQISEQNSEVLSLASAELHRRELESAVSTELKRQSEENTFLKSELRAIFVKLSDLAPRIDAVGDSLFDIHPDSSLKSEMDRIQLQFEELINSRCEYSPESIKRLIDLLTDYETVNIKQVSNLSGLNAEEIIEEIKPKSLPKHNFKVPSKLRSGKPREKNSYQKIEKGIDFAIQTTGDLIYAISHDDPLLEQARKEFTQKEGPFADKMLAKERLLHSMLERISANHRESQETTAKGAEQHAGLVRTIIENCKLETESNKIVSALAENPETDYHSAIERTTNLNTMEITTLHTAVDLLVTISKSLNKQLASLCSEETTTEDIYETIVTKILSKKQCVLVSKEERETLNSTLTSFSDIHSRCIPVPIELFTVLHQMIGAPQTIPQCSPIHPANSSTQQLTMLLQSHIEKSQVYGSVVEELGKGLSSQLASMSSNLSHEINSLLSEIDTDKLDNPDAATLIPRIRELEPITGDTYSSLTTKLQSLYSILSQFHSLASGTGNPDKELAKQLDTIAHSVHGIMSVTQSVYQKLTEFLGFSENALLKSLATPKGTDTSVHEALTSLSSSLNSIFEIQQASSLALSSEGLSAKLRNSLHSHIKGLKPDSDILKGNLSRLLASEEESQLSQSLDFTIGTSQGTSFSENLSGFQTELSQYFSMISLQLKFNRGLSEKLLSFNSELTNLHVHLLDICDEAHSEASVLFPNTQELISLKPPPKSPPGNMLVTLTGASNSLLSLKALEALKNSLTKDLLYQLQSKDKELTEPSLLQAQTENIRVSQELESLNEAYRQLEDEHSENQTELRKSKLLNRKKLEQLEQLQGLLDLANQRTGKDSEETQKLKEELKQQRALLRKNEDEATLQQEELDGLSRKLQFSQNQHEEAAKKAKDNKLNVEELHRRLTELEATNDELENRLRMGAHRVDDDSRKLLRDLERQEHVITQLRDQIQPLTRYRVIYQQLKTDNDDLEVKSKELEREAVELERQVKALTYANEQLKYANRLMKKYQTSELQLKTDVEKLTGKLRNYENFFGGGAGDYEGYIKQLEGDLDTKTSQNNETVEQLRLLQEDYKVAQGNRERYIKRQIIHRICRKSFVHFEDAFELWKDSLGHFSPSEREDPELVRTICLMPIPKVSQAVETRLPQNREVTEILIQEKGELLASNSIVAQYKAGAVKSEAITELNVIEFIEESMAHKYTLDEHDIEKHRIPRKFPEFFIEHLVLLYGKRKEMLKHLSAFLSTLKQMYDKKHPYGIFISQLLQMYDSSPITQEIASFLLRVNSLLAKCCKEAPGVGLEYGGQVYISEVITLFLELFRNDLEAGAVAMTLLKPAHIDQATYSKFRIVTYFQFRGISAEVAFKQCGGDIGKLPGIWLLPAEQLLFGELSRDSFSEAFSPATSALDEKSESFIVNKCSILSSVNDTLEYIKVRDLDEVVKHYKSSLQVPLGYNEFSTIVNVYDKSVPSEVTEQMFALGTYWSHELGLCVTAGSLYRVLLRFGIGKFRDSLLFINVPATLKAAAPIEENKEATPQPKAKAQPRRSLKHKNKP